MKKSLVFLQLLFLSSFAFSEDAIIQKLEFSRPDIQLNELPAPKRTLVLNLAKDVFQYLYVNLEHKNNLYNVDPVAQLNLLEQSYLDIPVDQFHHSMLLTFNSLNDMHLNYFLPKPYACYTVYLPLVFAKTSSGSILVKSIELSASTSFPQIVDISPGDELLQYEQKSVQVYIQERQKYITASTPESIFLQGIFDLYYRDLSYYLVPEKNDVELELKKPDGTVYTIVVPWYSKAMDSCIHPAPTPQNLIQSSLLLEQGSSRMEKLIARQQHVDRITEQQTKTNAKRSFSVGDVPDKVDLNNLNKTNLASLFWKTFTYQNKKIGYLRLKDFVDDNNDAADVVRAVLKDNLSDCEFLLIDLRGNYGGRIAFAEKMAALFSPQARSLPFYVRANASTYKLFEGTRDSNWANLILPKKDSNTVIGPAELTYKSTLSDYQQTYFGKVALLTNSECFSSCEIFAAAMKDNANVTIYGTDHSTLGGGANVLESNLIQVIFGKRLPQGIAMRVTLRHAYRLSTNTIIDDTGVPTDIYLTETVEDILDPKNSALVGMIFRDFLSQ